jgi:hypothetical protein
MAYKHSIVDAFGIPAMAMVALARISIQRRFLYMMQENWLNLSPSEKLNARLQAWKSPQGIQFASPAVEAAYQQRVQMLIDAIQLRKPVRVPICPNIGFYPFTYAGITHKEAMYDYDKLGQALHKFHADFMPDSLALSPLYGSGKVLEILDYKLYRWPGHGISEKTPYQCMEAEYMKASEYDDLINDPSGYFIRSYLPRIFGAFNPWQMLAPLTDILELPFVGGYMVPVGLPDVQQSFKKLLEAGQAALEWIQACGAIDGAGVAKLGLTPFYGGFSKAPFDTIGDTLRGTRHVMMDKFNHPDKLLAAMERWTPLAINMGVRSATTGNNPMVFIPLHKGADGFLSDQDFKKFYWPTLKALILGLIKEGTIPWLFVEGGYNQRLDVIADPDIPKGSTVWVFDRTDMKAAKKKLGGWACIGGNVPASLLRTNPAKDVKECVKRLIDDVAGDGGFILSTGQVVDDANPENLHALIEAGKEYGVY